MDMDIKDCYLLAICVFSVEKYPCRYVHHSQIESFVFLIYVFLTSLFSLDVIPILGMELWKHFLFPLCI